MLHTTILLLLKNSIQLFMEHPKKNTGMHVCMHFFVFVIKSVHRKKKKLPKTQHSSFPLHQIMGFYSMFLSARIASASASISPFFRVSDPKPQFHYLHNQQLCQFISDWLLRLDTRILTGILIKILAI